MYKYFYWHKFRKPEQSYKPVVLLTGCSSGIGLATAEALARHLEYRVIITTREKSMGVLKSKFTESDRIWIHPLDVASEESRNTLVTNIFERWGRVDILINNAGICYRSVLEEMQDKDELTQMQTNYLGPIGLIRLLLPRMRQNGRGKIINISSVSGIIAMPTMASYSASKFALEGAMEALWYETRPFGIDISQIQPGFVRSTSHERVKLSVRSSLSTQMNRPYSSMYQDMIPFITRFMTHGIATPKSIANLIMLVIKTEKPPLYIPASFDAEFLYYLKRFFPRRILQPFLFRTLPGSAHWAQDFTKARKPAMLPVRSFRNAMRYLGAHLYGKS